MQQNDLAFCRMGKQSISSTTGHTFCSSSRRSCSSTATMSAASQQSHTPRLAHVVGTVALLPYVYTSNVPISYLWVNFVIKSVFAFSKLICVILKNSLPSNLRRFYLLVLKKEAKQILWLIY